MYRYEYPGERNATTARAGSPRLAIGHGASRWTGWLLAQLACKRALDILISGTALIVLSPLFAAIAMALRIESCGPMFFTQERWGMNRRRVRVYKFRTMYNDDCDVSGVSQTVQEDTRITPIGRFLRKSNFDELPQLINILKGEMSLVGPRCHPIGMLAAGVPYEQLLHGYHLRHSMRPGLTGLAQINGLRGPTVDAKRAIGRIKYDRVYIRQFSIWLDIRIMAQTLIQEVRGGSGF